MLGKVALEKAVVLMEVVEEVAWVLRVARRS